MKPIVQEIYDIFKDYYGEERVDIKYNIVEENDKNVNHSIVKFNSNTHGTSYYANYDYCILIHWPKVTITNEQNLSIDIYNLYCAVYLTDTGLLGAGPLFTKSSYTSKQWSRHYVHSHVPVLNYDMPSTFKKSCLGTGPLVHTINLLSAQNDLDRWRLFVWELDKYVHVESLSGVPYINLSSVLNASERVDYIKEVIPTNTFRCSNDNNKELLKSFFYYLIMSNKFVFCFKNGQYYFGMSTTEFFTLISNLFIDWVNKDYEKRSYFAVTQLVKKVIISGKIYEPDDVNRYSMKDFVGEYLFMFKDKKVCLENLDNDFEGERNYFRMVNSILAGYLYYKILRFVNYYYGNKAVSPNKEIILL